MSKNLVGACIDGIDGIAYAVGFIEAISPQFPEELKKQSFAVLETLGTYTVDIRKAILEEIKES